MQFDRTPHIDIDGPHRRRSRRRTRALTWWLACVLLAFVLLPMFAGVVATWLGGF